MDGFMPQRGLERPDLGPTPAADLAEIDAETLAAALADHLEIAKAAVDGLLDRRRRLSRAADCRANARSDDCPLPKIWNV
jgi:hypothetical protein